MKTICSFTVISILTIISSCYKIKPKIIKNKNSNGVNYKIIENKILNKKLKLVYSWEYPNKKKPTDLTIGESYSIWIVDWYQRIFKLLPSKDVISIELKHNSKPVKALFVEIINNEKILINFNFNKRKLKLAKWDKGKTDIEVLEMPKDPFNIAWVKKRKEIWYSDLNSRLYQIKNNKIRFIDKRNVGRIFTNGDFIAYHKTNRKNLIDHIFIKEINSMKWRKIKILKDEYIFDISPKGYLLAILDTRIQYDDWLKPELLYLRTPNGKKISLLMSPIRKAVMRDNKIAILRYKNYNRDYVIELFELKEQSPASR